MRDVRMVKLKTGQAINPFAYTAKTATSGLITAATGDLAVIRTQTRPRGRHAPVEYELHLNPASIGVGIVGLGLATWLLQLRLHPSSGKVRVPATKIYHAEVGHWVSGGVEYDHMGNPHPLPSTWVVDIPASFEIVDAHETEVKGFSLQQRQGFGGSTSTPDILDIGGLGPLGAMTGTNPLFYGALYPLWKALGLTE